MFHNNIFNHRCKKHIRPYAQTPVILTLHSFGGIYIRLLLVLAILIAAVAFWLWWRTGGIEVALDKEALKTLPITEGVAEFSIMTYNVQARPVFDDSKHKFNYISPLLNNYDICAIQECFKDHRRLWTAAEHPVKLYHGVLKHSFKIVGSGLAMLGKLPLVESDGINFDAQGDAQNWPASKGVLMGRFMAAHDMLLDVYTTHIAAGRHEESMKAKYLQGDDIIAFINRKSSPENAVVLLGDFNMRPSRGPEDREANKDNPKVIGFDRIKEALNFRDASDEINGPIGKEIDRILFRPGKGCAMTALSWAYDALEFYDPEGVSLSDHKPVMVTFRLEKIAE